MQASRRRSRAFVGFPRRHREAARVLPDRFRIGRGFTVSRPAPRAMPIVRCRRKHRPPESSFELQFRGRLLWAAAGVGAYGFAFAIGISGAVTGIGGGGPNR